MKRKFLCLAAGLGLVSIAGIASLGANNGSIIMANNTKVEWRHYNAVKATATSNGSLEYWVSCADHTVQFTAPIGDNVNIVDKGDTHEEGWLDTLNGDEARRTAYTPNAFNSTDNFWRYFRIGAWKTGGNTGNGTIDVASNGTVNYELIKDAHALGIKYLYFHIRGVAKNGETINSIPFARTTLAGETTFDVNGLTYIQDSNSFDSVARGNGNGVIINVDDFYDKTTANKFAKLDNANLQTIFEFEARNASNQSVTPDCLSFSSLECFDTLEQAKAFKSLDKVLESNPWDYFRYVTAPSGSDGTEFTFTSNSASLNLTKKFVENAKAAGKKKVTFNVKMSTDDATKSITTIYAQSSYAGGTDASGKEVNYQTDFHAYDGNNVKDGATTVTLELEKLFDENVTFNNGSAGTTGDYAYNISGRVTGGTDTYTSSSDNVTVTVSDFKYE